MVASQVDVLRVAAAEIGYQAGYDPQPGSKYGRWAADVTGQRWLAGPSRQVPFCDLFVSWVFAHAGAGPAVGVSGKTVYAYTVAHREWFRLRGLYVPVSQAAPGDVVFFDWRPGGDPVEHVGIVERNLGGGVLQCIEGNTSNGRAGSQANGGGVWRRARKWGIATVCRPAWNLVQTQQPKSKPKHVDNLWEEVMEIAVFNGQCWAYDGITRRYITSSEELTHLVSLGVKKVNVGAWFINTVPELTLDSAKTHARVREMKDILTDYPGMSEGLKNTSVLRKLEEPAGITPRTN